MGEKSMRSDRLGYRYLTGERRQLHLLRQPHGYAAGMAWGTVGYQMRYSVETLEAALAEEGNPHVLQLDVRGEDRQPQVWSFYADGTLVAGGDGEYATQCFEESAEKFRDVCRAAVAAAALPPLSQREYQLLRAARSIARVERAREAAEA